MKWWKLSRRQGENSKVSWDSYVEQNLKQNGVIWSFLPLMDEIKQIKMSIVQFRLLQSHFN